MSGTLDSTTAPPKMLRGIIVGILGMSGYIQGTSGETLTVLKPCDPAPTAAQIRIEQRIDALAEIKEGWLEGRGLAVSANARALAKEVTSALVGRSQELANPSIYPAGDGGVQVEWVNDKWLIDMRFAPDGRSASVGATPRGSSGPDCDRDFSAAALKGKGLMELERWLLSPR